MFAYATVNGFLMIAPAHLKGITQSSNDLGYKALLVKCSKHELVNCAFFLRLFILMLLHVSAYTTTPFTV